MRRTITGWMRAPLVIVLTWGLAYANSSAEPMQITRLTENQQPETAPSVADEVSKPTTEKEFFENIKIVLDEGLLLQEGFYTKENLGRFFAAVNVASGTEHDEDVRKTRLWVRASDFDGIFPSFKRDGASGLIHDAQISLGLTINTSSDDEGQFNFVMQTDGPSFEEIKNIFSGEFTLNKSTSLQPPPPPTGPHANEGWWYALDTSTERIRGFFQFNSAGFLEQASFKVQRIKGN